MRRKSMLSIAVGCLLAAGGLAALISSAGEATRAEVPARSARDFFPRNPLLYVELSGVDQLEARLAGLKLWKDEAGGRAEAARLAELAARQLSLLVGEDDPQQGRRMITQIRSLHVAIYPPASFPPELLIAVEVKDPAAFMKLLVGPTGGGKLDGHLGCDVRRLPFSLNGTRRRGAATVSGNVVLLSPYDLRLRQALEVAAAGQGGLAESPGFADCQKRFSDRPLWGYVNAVALSSAGALDEHMVRDVQEPLVALGLPSYRWAGFSSTLGQGPVALELHLEFYKWSPLAALGPLDKPPSEVLAAATPADAMFFAALNAGAPEAAWNRLRPWLVRIAAMDSGGDDEDEPAGDKPIEEIRKEFKSEFGIDFEKDLLPLLSGEIGFFMNGGKRVSFGVLLAARDEAAARKLMAALKVEDGTIGSPGGRDRGSAQVARIGRVILLTEGEDAARNVLAAVAAGKTLAGSAEYKKGLEALGAGQGLIHFVSVGAVQGAAEGRGLEWLSALSGGYAGTSGASLTPTGLTVRSTAPLEMIPLLALLPEMEQVAAGMTGNACGRRLENLGAAAAEFSRGHQGRWPASFDELGEGFKAGSSSRKCPADGKEYAFAALGVIPPKAQDRGFVLCHGIQGGHGPGNGPETCLLVVRRGATRAEPMHEPAGALTARLAADQAILALADPKRLQLSDEEKKSMAAAAADLGHENFERREAATKRLLDLGPKAAPTLLTLLGSKDPEAADRAETILKKLTGLAKKEEMLRLAP